MPNKKPAPKKKAQLKPTAGQLDATARTEQSEATARKAKAERIAKALVKGDSIDDALRDADDANAAAFDEKVKAVTDQDAARTSHKERAPDKGAELSDKEKKELAKLEAKAAAAKRLEQNGGKPKLYYSRLSKDFWLKMPQGFRTYDKGEIKVHLIKAGVSEFAKTEDGVWEIDSVFSDAQVQREMDYIGPLPGYRVGEHTVDGRKMLVTDEADPRLWEALPKEPVSEEKCRFHIEFFSALLHEQMQDKYLCYALAVWLRAVRNAAINGPASFRPLPFFVFVGQPKFGKSTLQDIITRILGGRAENPAKAMMEGEKFTAPLLRAEHWTFGDPPGTTRLEDRIFFGDKIKEFSHEQTFVFRGMQKEGFKVRCMRWVDASFNDHESDLRKLPPWREGLKDKGSLERCSDAREFLKKFSADAQGSLAGFDSVDGVDWPRVQKTINDEVPFFRQFLLQNFKTVPEVWADMRGGVSAFHHSGLLREVGELSPQANFLTFVDDALFNATPEVQYNGEFVFSRESHSQWTERAVDYPYVIFSASELQKRLKACALPRAFEDRLHLIGRDMGDLASSHPTRISKATSATNPTGIKGGVQFWKITNPFTQHTQKET